MPDERVETNEESGAVQTALLALISSQQRRYRPGDERERTRMQSRSKIAEARARGGGFFRAQHPQGPAVPCPRS